VSDVQFIVQVVSGNSETVINNISRGFDGAERSAGSLTNAIKKIGESAFALNQISQNISGLKSDFDNAIKPGIDFNSSLKDMQAITGVNNQQLDLLGKNARQMAKDFGIDAAGAVESNKLLLSQLSPEIANNAEALNGMTRNAVILGKQLGGDTAGATQILTTAMNQYGVSLNDPMKATHVMSDMMNIMAAAAKEGSAELPQIKNALEQSGMMAKTANVSFAELNAGIQVLDKAGKRGAEGGVALRNVMAQLSEGEFISRRSKEMLEAAGISVTALGDKSKTLSQRLALLKPIANDTAAMTLLFGKENVAAGIALVNNTGYMDELRTKIVGTNTATEMAGTIMGSFSERVARSNAWLKDAGISLFNATEGFIPFINIAMSGIQVMSNLGGAVQAFSILSQTNMVKSIVSAISGLGAWVLGVINATAAQMGLNVAMSANPIGLIVIGIAAAIAAIALLINYWDDIKAAIGRFVAWVADHNPFGWLIDLADRIFPGFKKKVGEIWDWIKGKFEALVGIFKSVWNWIKGLFGSDDKNISITAAAQKTENMGGMEKVPGIDTADTPTTSSALAGYKPHHKGKGLKESGSNITGAGSRPTNITINIHKLQDQTVIHTTKLEMGSKQAADKILSMLLEAINGANAALT
jgi:TP901 family phage tail tape measure protein